MLLLHKLCCAGSEHIFQLVLTLLRNFNVRTITRSLSTDPGRHIECFPKPGRLFTKGAVSGD